MNVIITESLVAVYICVYVYIKSLSESIMEFKENKCYIIKEKYNIVQQSDTHGILLIENKAVETIRDYSFVCVGKYRGRKATEFMSK